MRKSRLCNLSSLRKCDILVYSHPGTLILCQWPSSNYGGPLETQVVLWGFTDVFEVSFPSRKKVYFILEAFHNLKLT